MRNVVYPFLKVNNLLGQGKWLTEEHLVVTVLRSKIIYAIEKTVEAERKEKTVLLFLPDYKQLDLALLYMHFHLKNSGIQVIYMGSNVTIENLKEIFEKMNPQFLFTYLPSKNNFQFEKLLLLLNTNQTRLVLTMQAKATNRQFNSDKILLLKFEEALAFLADISGLLLYEH